jgi:hypothetical protein
MDSEQRMSMIDALDGAHCVTIEEGHDLAVVWHGGAIFNVYNLSTWYPVDAFSRYGDDSTGQYVTAKEARAASLQWLEDCLKDEGE